ncbi:FAD synthase [Candidatus Woesearchaeota archaeon]|nr:FAD synthase [Candidatus Woesearchaeota archaeon]
MRICLSLMRVLVFGTFDNFHKGHEFFLAEAKKLGTELHVVIARDETVERIKGKPPRNDHHKRRERVQAFEHVDVAVLGNKGDVYKIIEDIRPDLIVLGYDQNHFTERLEEELKKRGIAAKIVRLGSFEPEKYKSSKM